jgi:hypothetical protein
MQSGCGDVWLADTGGTALDGSRMGRIAPYVETRYGGCNEESWYSYLLSAQVLHVHPNSVLFTRKPRSGWVIFHEMEETKKTQ